MRAARGSCLLLAGLFDAPPPSFTERVQDLLGIPYVADGVLDARGTWTTFAHPAQERPTPGLNCSGLTALLASRLLGFPLDPHAVARDRGGDSGPDAPAGQDWDFGLDLILNLSEGYPRRVLMPGVAFPPQGDGAHLRGFSLDDATAWGAVLPLLRPDRLYLASLSRGGGSGRLRHYHTAVLLRDARGIWFYHTLPGGRAHRLDLSRPEGRARLEKIFGRGKRILLLEVTPPAEGPSLGPGVTNP